jgi:hypothetical protein
MKIFELQWVTDNLHSTPIGVLIFDIECQQIRHAFLDSSEQSQSQMLIEYLKKEFQQMQHVMESGLSFTPFVSVSLISAQLLPGENEPVRFSPPQKIQAADIERALVDAKSSLSA